MIPAVTVTIEPGVVVGGIVALAALLAALGALGRHLARMARILRAVGRLVEGELEHNHGGSMKDDVYGIAVSVGELGREVTDLNERLTAHLIESSSRRNTP